jgi:Putative DNA-binding domain
VTKLHDQQKSFQDWVLTKGEMPIPEVRALDGLKVYHFAYRSRLLEALGETFEKTWAWLGDVMFDAAVADYIDAQVPTARSLDQYGALFPNFLKAKFPDDPEIADLALIEWALRICFSGADAEPVDAATFANSNWERASLRLMPTYAEHRVITNAPAIWRALADNLPPPARVLMPKFVKLCFWRKGFSPQFRALDGTEAEALTLVQQGQSFADICAVIGAKRGPKPPTSLMGNMLSRWYLEGLIAAIDEPAN